MESCHSHISLIGAMKKEADAGFGGGRCESSGLGPGIGFDLYWAIFFWSSLIKWWVNMGESGLMYSIVILDLAILFTVIQPLRMSEVWLHCAMRLTKDEWRPGEMGRVRTKWRFCSLGKSNINGACLMFSRSCSQTWLAGEFGISDLNAMSYTYDFTQYQQQRDVCSQWTFGW